MYNALIEDCFFQPKHVGSIDLSLPLAVHSRKGNTNSNIIDLYMQCNDKGFIERICFKSNGNPYIIAGLEWLCRQLTASFLPDLVLPDYQLLVEKLEIPTNQYPVALQIEGVFKEALVLMKKKLRGIGHECGNATCG